MLAAVHGFACVIPEFEVQFVLREAGSGPVAVVRTIALAVAEGKAESFSGYPTFTPGICAMGEPASGAPPLVAAGTGAHDRINATGTVTMAKAVLSAVASMGCALHFADEDATKPELPACRRGVLVLAAGRDPSAESLLDKRLGAAIKARIGAFDVDQTTGTAMRRGCTPFVSARPILRCAARAIRPGRTFCPHLGHAVSRFAARSQRLVERVPRPGVRNQRRACA